MQVLSTAGGEQLAYLGGSGGIGRSLRAAGPPKRSKLRSYETPSLTCEAGELAGYCCRNRAGWIHHRLASAVIGD